MDQFDFYRKLNFITYDMFSDGATDLLAFEDFPKKDFFIIVDVSDEEEEDIKGIECQLEALELGHIEE